MTLHPPLTPSKAGVQFRSAAERQIVGVLSDALKPSFGVQSLGVAPAILFLLNAPSAIAFYLSGRLWGRAPQGVST